MPKLTQILPPWLHRTALRIANPMRHAWWRLLRKEVHGAMILAFTSDARLLLVRHSYAHTDKWMLPGGGFARGEDALAAAARELSEEADCALDSAVLIESYVVPIRAGWTNRIELVTGTLRGTPRGDGREIAAVMLAPLDDLPAGTSSGTHDQIARWRAWRDAAADS